MNALVAVDPLPATLLITTEGVRDIAIRLADEGIPVRAIARATKVPSEDLYEVLKEAMLCGYILELPKDDWPPGSNRAQRLAVQGTILDNEDTLKFACARMLKATRLEAAILAVLLRRQEVTKQQLHAVIEQNRPSENRDETDPKMVDVIICHLRKKLKPHALEIETVWGIGYLMKPAHRDNAVLLLTAFTGAN